MPLFHYAFCFIAGAIAFHGLAAVLPEHIAISVITFNLKFAVS